jgi:hypothetical protein
MSPRILGLAAILAMACTTTPLPNSASARADTDRGASPSCDAAIRRLASGMKRPMELTVRATPDQRSSQAGERHLRTLERLAEHADGKLLVRSVVRDSKPEESSEVLELTMRYGDVSESIPLAYEKKWEDRYFFALKIRELSDRVHKRSYRIAIVSAPGSELDAPHLTPPRDDRAMPTVDNVFSEAVPHYQLIDIEAHDIDSSFDGVFVLQRMATWQERDLRALDAYVLGGGAVVVLAGAVNLPPAESILSANLDTHGLDRLLSAYGIELHRDLVRDASAEMRFPIGHEGESAWLHAPGIFATTDIDPRCAALYRLEEIAVPYPSSLAAHPERQPAARLRTVVRSGDASVVTTGDTLDLSIERSPDELTGNKQKRAIGMTVEGVHRSAFGNAPGTGRGRLLVIASPQFLANPFARAGNPEGDFDDGDRVLQELAWIYAREHMTGMFLAFKFMIDWLTADEDLLACFDG